jgi:hypothetical protein
MDAHFVNQIRMQGRGTFLARAIEPPPQKSCRAHMVREARATLVSRCLRVSLLDATRERGPEKKPCGVFPVCRRGVQEEEEAPGHWRLLL